jgi:hypothetical protein
MTRTRRTILASACAGALSFAGGAFAAGTTTLFVNGTVTGVCQFVASGYSMSFGQLDPSTTTDVTRTTTISYLCTNGTAASSIQVYGAPSPTTVNVGKVGNPASVLPVHMSWTTPATAGSGFAPGTVPISFDVTGTIAATDINVAQAGFYINRVPITLMP